MKEIRVIILGAATIWGNMRTLLELDFSTGVLISTLVLLGLWILLELTIKFERGRT